MPGQQGACLHSVWGLQRLRGDDAWAKCWRGLSGRDAGNVVFHPGDGYMDFCFVLLCCTCFVYAYCMCVIFHINNAKRKKKDKQKWTREQRLFSMSLAQNFEQKSWWLMFLYTLKCFCIGKAISYTCKSQDIKYLHMFKKFFLFIEV